MDPADVVKLAQQVLPEEECKALYDPNLLPNGVSAIEDKWKLLPAFLKVKGFVRQHVDSFNNLVETDMTNIMMANREVICTDPNIRLVYNRIYVESPRFDERGAVGTGSRVITPNECRLRDLTYSGAIKVDIVYTKRTSSGVEKTSKSDVTIGRIPMMLRCSKCHLHGKTHEQLAEMRECPLDPGGYFIVKGVEKVALVQENLQTNRILAEVDSKGDYSCIVNSSTHLAKSRTVLVLRNGCVKLAHNSFTEELNAMVVLKAMGCESEQEAIQMIGTERSFGTVLLNTMNECVQTGVFTQKQALEYVGSRFVPETFRTEAQEQLMRRKKVDRAADFLANVILCHIPVHEWDYRNKIANICIMIRRMLLARDDPSLLDDKDYYGNKRLELAGSLLSLLFEDLFKVFNQQIKSEADNLLEKQQRAQPFDFSDIMRKNTSITNGIQYAVSSGNWFIKHFKVDKKGVTQVLSRYSYISALGMMTRVASGVDASLKLAGPRSLQPSQWGMLCPADTPEGEKCGLVKNLSLLCQVTSMSPEGVIADICLDLGVEDIETTACDDIRRSVTVFLNGHLLGVHQYHNRFLRQFRDLRRRGRIDSFTSIQYNATLRTITIACDEGRVCRPLIIVEKGQPSITLAHLRMLADGVLTFYDFIKSGYVEYLDVNEENNSYVAMREESITMQSTHLEIEPFTILGVVAGLVPFPHHNQSPRNTYQCAMGKQAMGAIAYNQQARIDTVLYLLVYPQKPLCKTRIIDLIGTEQLPAGNNCMVAVMSYSGYDIEDAQIWNKCSIDRGLGRCMMMKKMTVTLRKGRTTDNLLEQHDELVRPKPADAGSGPLAQLDADGIVPQGAQVRAGDVLVNKHVPTLGADANGQSMIRYVPAQLKFKGVFGVVDQVLLCSDDDQKTVKVLIRETRQPEFGDKFSSRHGQKGVCGLIVHQADLPFNRLGMCPDLIMNPHGFPSRMTVGKMIEMTSGKAGLTTGKHAYATAFGDQTDRGTGADKVKDIGETLVRAGYSYHGKDLMTSGLTGEQCPSYTFFGPIYYQKLKHMVLDKMHARAVGRRAMLTRQPTEGRSRGGGMRLGEMERDCLVGYGASMLLNERLMFSSDAFLVHVCATCGLIGYSGYCKFCNSYDKVHSVRVPYACKLLFQEMMSMNIIPKLKMAEY
ncbi:DNA-directed RNA polymerase III subunit RPC2 [Diplonema papillatum]|nr:DNA-directed RNA polymerase III subunit RPC2 [Diplonema papillatum]